MGMPAMVTMRNPGRVGITVLARDEAPISKVQGNGRDANEEEDDESGRLNSGEEAERGGPGTGGTAGRGARRGWGPPRGGGGGLGDGRSPRTGSTQKERSGGGQG